MPPDYVRIDYAKSKVHAMKATIIWKLAANIAGVMESIVCGILQFVSQNLHS